MNLPPKDHLAWARAEIEKWVADLERRAALPQNADKPNSILARTAVMARRELLGNGGCVIARFDGRWLDDEFRAALGEKP